MTTQQRRRQRGRVEVRRRIDEDAAPLASDGQLGAEAIDLLRRLVLGDFAPGLTLLFDVPVALGLERAGTRNVAVAGADGRYESMGEAFHARVRDGVLAIARAEPERVAVIDSAQPMEAVAAAVAAVLRARYPGEIG